MNLKSAQDVRLQDHDEVELRALALVTAGAGRGSGQLDRVAGARLAKHDEIQPDRDEAKQVACAHARAPARARARARSLAADAGGRGNLSHLAFRGAWPCVS